MVFAVALIALAAQDTGLFESVVGTPTGKNGYEDIVRAAALVAEPSFRALVSNLPPLGDRDWLERRRMVVAHAERPLSLTDSGLAKPITHPNPVPRLDSLNPELVHIQTLSKVLCCKVAVNCADGAPESAAEALSAGFRLARVLLVTGGDLHTIVGFMVYDRMFECLEHSKWYLTPKNLDTVLSSLEITPLGAWTDKVSRINDGAIATAQDIARDAPRVLKTIGLKDSEVPPEVLASWNRLSLEERQSLVARYRDSLDSALSHFRETLALPESEWGPAAASHSEALPVDIPGASLLWSVEDLVPTLVNRLAELRTRVRLARLECLVLRQRWTHGAWPSNLAQFALEERRNPQTLRDFQYELRGKRYVLWAESLSRKVKVGMAGVIKEENP